MFCPSGRFQSERGHYVSDTTIQQDKEAERQRAAEWQHEWKRRLKPKDDIQKLVFQLEAEAIQQCKDELITATPDNSDDPDVLYRYDPQQGYKAAHYARQDTIVIYGLMITALHQFRHLQHAAYVIILLLAVIVYKVW